jgi:hypothetical protein
LLILSAKVTADEPSTPGRQAPPPIESTATEAELQLLQTVQAIQPEAVVVLTEARATAQALQRARGYTEQWHDVNAVGKGSIDGVVVRDKSIPKKFLKQAHWMPGKKADREIAELDTKLGELRERFLDLHHGHYGNQASYHYCLRNKLDYPTTIEISDHAETMTQDPEARAEARESFLRDCYALRDQTGALLARLREEVLALQRAATASDRIPTFELSPAFVDKSMPTMHPDGTVSGLLISVSGLTSHPGVRALRTEYARSYARNLRNYWEAVEQGRRCQLIVPCAVGSYVMTTTDFVNDNSHLPIFRDPKPKLPLTSQSSVWLDFYHPAVRDQLEGILRDVAARFRGNPLVLFYTHAWEPVLTDQNAVREYPWGKWPTGGRHPAGVVAFRKCLEKRFGAIEKLNAAWQARYRSFDAVEPPTDVAGGPEPQRTQLIEQLYAGQPTPLYYEFNRFLKESYADYLAWGYRVLKEADPTHAVSASPSHGALDGYLCMGRDSWRWAEDVCDIFGSELTGSMEEIYTYSINRTTGRTTGQFENVWNAPENYTFPPEHVVSAAGGRNIWRLVAWGRRAITLYGAEDTYGGTSNNNMFVMESNYSLVRRGAGIIPVVKRKLRSMEDIWFEAPIMEPKILLLRPTSSQLCAYPWDRTEAASQVFHDLIYPTQYHYAFLPEEYLIAGRDDLKNYDVLLLPFATNLPDALTDAILSWVKEGGTLAMLGPAGLFTSYGQADGRLMRELFGDITFERSGDLAWQIVDQAPAVQKAYGQGYALVAGDAADLAPKTPAAKTLLELIDRAAPRSIWTTGSPAEMVVRQDQRGRHITLINPSAQQPAQITVHLRDKAGMGIDRGIERGFPLPIRDEGETRAFDIALMPGEGTVISLL